MNVLLTEYKKRKNEIRERLSVFKKQGTRSERIIFSEMCFCILTPQAKAIMCDTAIKTLMKNKLLYFGNREQIRSHLYGVRFPNNKAAYLEKARRLLEENGLIRIKKHIDPNNIHCTREWFAKHIIGIGIKEASHFLRNIGFGRKLAIIDVHVLRFMLRYNLREENEHATTVKKYYAFEKRIEEFSKRIRIPMDELDMLLWAMNTGYVFK